jgi:ferredoxin-NADP reductase
VFAVLRQISGPIDGPNIDLSPTSPIKKLGWVTCLFCFLAPSFDGLPVCRLICGGTGLSPMSQILREIFYSKRLDIEISMIYACPRPDSFPYYELLQRKAASHPNFKLTCTVDSTAGLPWDEVGRRAVQLHDSHVNMLLCYSVPTASWVCYCGLDP